MGLLERAGASVESQVVVQISQSRSLAREIAMAGCCRLDLPIPYTILPPLAPEQMEKLISP